MGQRLKILTSFFLLCFLVVFIRLFYWQVISHKNLSSLAARQYLNKKEIPSERGKIFSKDKYPLVLNTQSFLLFADPSKIKVSPEEIKGKVSLVVKEEKIVNTENLFDKTIFWAPLISDLSLEEKQKVEKLQIAGLGFEEKDKRFYPEASMSAHLLGFVGEDEEGNNKGYFGLEGYYDNELKGRSGLRYFEQDALGRPIPLTDELEEKALAGRDLILFLDRPLQFLVEKKLQEGVKKYQASSGLVVVMEPKTGAIVSMAAFPGYEPNKYFSYSSDLYRNPVISSNFEPGSIFKIIVMASALDAKAVNFEEKCTACNGPRTLSGYTIKTWNEKYFPSSSMTDIIVHSDNVGMVYVMEKLGRNNFSEYLKKFGFGEKTGIDLQGEASLPIKEEKFWSSIDLATASFGQGIAITPIQMITAVSAIANKGELVQPSVVKSILENEKEISVFSKNRRQVITEETANQVKTMMVEAVEKGEAKWAKPAGYKIAGKTGTAQIPIAGHYDPEKTIASFVGFAPPDEPKFVMLVMLTEPNTSPWGSETAAPLWFDIAQDIFKLWGIKPYQGY